MLAGADVELVGVPRAHRVELRLRESEALAGAVGGDHLVDLGDDPALAHRPAHVRAQVLVGEEVAAELVHSDLDAVDLDHLAAGILELRSRPDIAVAHCAFPAQSVPIRLARPFRAGTTSTGPRCACGRRAASRSP